MPEEEGVSVREHSPYDGPTARLYSARSAPGSTALSLADALHLSLLLALVIAGLGGGGGSPDWRSGYCCGVGEGRVVM